MGTRKPSNFSLTTGIILLFAACGNGSDFSGSTRIPGADSSAKYEQDFAATDVENVQVGLNIGSRYITQRISLKEDPEQVVTIKQANRPIDIIEKRQGKKGGTDNLSFQISESGKVDLIVVIDNSGSMNSNNIQVANKIDSLIDQLANTNWQIGVISTDPKAFSNPNIREDAACISANYLIKKGDPDPKTKFRTAMNLRGSADTSEVNVERPFTHILKALGVLPDPQCAAPVKWLRPDASLAFLFASDEDDCGTVYNPNDPIEQDFCNADYGRRAYFKGSNATYFLNQLSAIRSLTGPYPVRAYGLIVDPDVNSYPIADCSPLDTAHGIRTGNHMNPYSCELKRVINSTGGISSNLFDSSSFTSVLQKIGADISKIATREFVLDHEPDNLILEVKVGNDQTQTVITSGFTISGNKLVLDPIYAASEKLYIRYSYGNVPMFNSIQLSQTPDLATLSVTYDGVPTKNYTYTDAAKTLTLDPAPVENAKVLVTYRRFTQALASSFSVGALDVIPETLKVTVDGILSAKVNYQNGMINFFDSPSDGQTIEAKFKTLSGKKTQYPRGFQDDRPTKQIWANVEDTKSPIDVQEKDGQVIFKVEDIVDGKNIIVVWDFGEKSKEHSIQLASTPIKDSLKVTGNRPGSNCTNNLTIDNATLKFECNTAELDSIGISYDYIKSHTNIFVLRDGIPTGANSYSRVFVNDLEISKFKRNGATITIDPVVVPLLAKVKVVVYMTTTPTALVEAN